MRNFTAASGLAFLLAGTAGASLFGRDKVQSRWTAARIAVNGDDADWAPESAFEADGISIQARNDSKDLYLLISAHTRDGRDQLTGEARENVALWFVGTDRKTREWGAVLPFAHREPLTAALRDPAGVDPEPEFARLAGTAVSTAAWPAELPDRLAASARRPVWELKIPLERLSVRPDRTVALDFIVTSSGARRSAPASIPEEGGRRHAAPAPPSGPPDGVSLYVAVRLADGK
jgi:hypothetical protein